MKKSILTLLLIGVSLMASAHNLYFDSCNNGNLKFHTTQGVSGTVTITLRNSNGNRLTGTCAYEVTIPTVNNNVSFTIPVNRNCSPNNTYVRVKWNKDNYENNITVNKSKYCDAVLPIKIYDFNARKVNDIAELSWRIGESSNFSHFEIQGMNDSKEIFSLGTTVQNHFEVATELKYLRLKAIDLDNTFEFTKWVAVIRKEKEMILIEKRSNGNLYWDGFKKVFVQN